MTINDHEDLLIEILLWLPTISLIRFKLVCKRWFSLISSHHFSHTHTLLHPPRSKPEPSFLIRLADTSAYFHLKLHRLKWAPYHISPPLVEPITISGSSNGLFLLHSDTRDPIHDCFIYNPTTRQCTRILLNVNKRHICVLGLNLAFDPLISPHYKIVCVRATRRGTSSGLLRSRTRFCQIEVYVSESGTWRVCEKPSWLPRDLDFDQGVYWKGGVHWRGVFFYLNDDYVREHPELVVPGDSRRDNFYHSYVESRGSLYFVAHFIKEKSVMVFEMQSDYSQWLLKYNVVLDQVSGPVSVLSFVRGEREEDGVLVLHEPGKVIAYNFQEKSVKEIVDFRGEAFYQDGSIQFVSGCTFQFMETLAPI